MRTHRNPTDATGVKAKPTARQDLLLDAASSSVLQLMVSDHGQGKVRSLAARRAGMAHCQGTRRGYCQSVPPKPLWLGNQSVSERKSEQPTPSCSTSKIVPLGECYGTIAAPETPPGASVDAVRKRIRCKCNRAEVGHRCRLRRRCTDVHCGAEAVVQVTGLTHTSIDGLGKVATIADVGRVSRLGRRRCWVVGIGSIRVGAVQPRNRVWSPTFHRGLFRWVWEIRCFLSRSWHIQLTPFALRHTHNSPLRNGEVPTDCSSSTTTMSTGAS